MGNLNPAKKLVHLYKYRYGTFHRGRCLQCNSTGLRGHGGCLFVWNKAIILFLTFFNFQFSIWIVKYPGILTFFVILLVQIFFVTILSKFCAFFILEVAKLIIEAYGNTVLLKQYDLLEKLENHVLTHKHAKKNPWKILKSC